MIYPDTFEQKTGFDAVRRRVGELCATSEGRLRADEMAFTAEAAEVERRLRITAEMLAIVSGDDDIAIGRVRDIGPAVASVRVPGTYMPAAELVGVRASLEATAEIIAYFARRRDEGGRSPYPRLDALVADLSAFPDLTTAISRVIDRYGNVLDNASPELAELRRSQRRLQGSLSSAMRRVVQEAVKAGVLEADASPSVRDGRLVIPVPPMYKRRIAGIVHDESASGKTVFIEPAEIVETNNRLRELEMEERREIVRILTCVADLIRASMEELLYCIDTLGELDFIHAKGLYAREIGGMMPQLAERPEMEWYHACHPVLLATLSRQGKEIVPLDITLTPERRILVISGPNAGGKSVCIKTVAIVQYMLQCGMLPPIYENSHAGVFSDIMIDIGDDQSIEDDLSTYSSHLRNMKLMLQRGRATSLFIVDEMGSGTEPQIGGALAQAILGSFNDKGMWGVVTTHYQNLKTFASETPGLVNGSMLYDRQQMRPLFRLSIGSPGSSFAVEIARKIGLPAPIIDRAEEIVGSDYINLDRYLLDITRDKRYWENKRADIRRKEKKIDAVLEQYEENADELRRRRREILDDARREAERILQDSNASIERTIHDIRRAQADREKTLEARRRFEAERAELTAADSAGASADHPLLQKAPKKRREQPAKPNRRTAATRDLTVGDVVKLEGQTTPGRIIDISGDQATVAFGMLKTTVKLSRLRPSDAQIKSGARSGFVTDGGASRQRQLEFNREIDVRGMRVDEGVQAVTYFIDDAIQFGADRVRILHGTGTGALRQYIRQYLATVPQVTSARDEDVRFGGAGITVVTLA